jgi:hypothetical protein
MRHCAFIALSSHRQSTETSPVACAGARKKIRPALLPKLHLHCQPESIVQGSVAGYPIDEIAAPWANGDYWGCLRQVGQSFFTHILCWLTPKPALPFDATMAVVLTARYSHLHDDTLMIESESLRVWDRGHDNFARQLLKHSQRHLGLSTASISSIGNSAIWFALPLFTSALYLCCATSDRF